MNLKEDVDHHSFVSAEDPTDCTLVVVGGKFIKRFPEVLKRIDGEGWREGGESYGPEVAIRKIIKTSI